MKDFLFNCLLLYLVVGPMTTVYLFSYYKNHQELSKDFVDVFNRFLIKWLNVLAFVHGVIFIFFRLKGLFGF